MSQGVSPEELRQLTRYSYAHLAACLPFVALGGFGIISPWVFVIAALPLGGFVGWCTRKPPRAGILAGIAGMGVAEVISGILAALGGVLDPRMLTNPRQAIGLGAGAVVGCLIGWLVWDSTKPGPLQS